MATAIAASMLALAPEAAARSRHGAAASQHAAATSQREPTVEPYVGPNTKPDTKPDAKPATVSSNGEPRGTEANGRLSQYLRRPVRFGAHFVDHGVLQVAAAGGYPHRYRLELSLGVLDHLTLGATTHWLPGQSTPKVSPVVAVAFFRNRLFEVGAWHFWSLYPPPVDDVDPATSSYQRSAQWFLGTASFGQAWLTGGLDAGVVRARVNDPGMEIEPDTSNPSVIRWMFGGGLHLRAGTRRWGFTAQVLLPQMLAELRFDVRFGLFEKRSKGGWRPYGMAEDWDRPVPFGS